MAPAAAMVDSEVAASKVALAQVDLVVAQQEADWEVVRVEGGRGVAVTAGAKVAVARAEAARGVAVRVAAAKEEVATAGAARAAAAREVVRAENTEGVGLAVGLAVVKVEADLVAVLVAT
jgi:hypothetical protein